MTLNVPNPHPDWLARLGAEPPDSSPVARGRTRALVATAVLLGTLATGSTAWALVRGAWGDGVVAALLALIGVGSLCLLRARALPVEPLGHLVLAALTLGLWRSPLFHEGVYSASPLLLLVVPPGAALLIGQRGLAVWTSAVLASQLGILGLHLFAGYRHDPAHPPLDRWMYATVATLGVAGASWALLAIQGRVSRELRRAVEALETENAQRRTAEREALQARDAEARFLATMSHELRTPLHGVIGAADLLRDQGLGGDQAELVRAIRGSSAVLKELIDDILDLSRLEAGELRLDTAPVDVARLLDEVASPLRVLAEAKGVRLEVQALPSTPPFVAGDATRLRQILYNLAGNAVKFTHEGRVILRSEGVEEGLRLTVQDTGIGMAPEVVAGLFHRFRQADPTIARKYGGSGLGLFIVKALTELMGGTVQVEATPRVGSTFRITLPLPTAAPVAPETPVPVAVRPHRVLVVDDVALNRLLARRMLEPRGHEILEASSGYEALDRIVAGVDLVFLDLQMPDLDGLAVARRVRALAGPARRTPLVALSASSLDRERRAALEAGMDDYVTKPFVGEDLQQVIEAHLDRRRSGPGRD
jgi:two-component system, sensor histidine kinase